MTDLKSTFRDWRKRKQQARAQMVECDYCGDFDGYKVWPNEPCPRCGETTERAFEQSKRRGASR